MQSDMRWVVVAVFVALTAVFAACGDDDDPSPSPSASPTSSASNATSPSLSPSTSPVETIEITQGADTDFPDDMALLIETGCWQCDGPPTGLVRFYKNAAGEMVGDKLLSYRDNSDTLVDINGAEITTSNHIMGLEASQDASVIAFGVCTQGVCGTGLDAFDPTSVTTVFRSMDGGVTWEELGQKGPAVSVFGVTADGSVFAWNVTENLGTPEYLTMPDGVPLAPPADGLRPVVATDDILWATEDGLLLRSDGTEFADLPHGWEDDPYAVVTARGTVAAGEKSSALIHWQVTESNTSLGFFSPIDGGGVPRVVLRGDELSHLAGWYRKDSRAVVSATLNRLYPRPALLDIETGEYNVIPEPFDNPGSLPETTRTLVAAVQTGPFARVVNTGSCLNIRVDPSSVAEVVTCTADGVLLRTQDEATAEGIEWLRVTTPSGQQGWASAEFLER